MLRTVWLKLPNIFDLYGWNALKGQKLLAQGNALGIKAVSKAPCKGKSFTNCQEFLKLLPLQGAKFTNMITQGVALG